jgi:RNA polymerase sigma-70 factor (ECF subfamily)
VTDEALMVAVRDGDLASLGALFERYHMTLYEFLARTTGDRAAAEDLVQDVFVRILKYRQTYRDDSRFETWLYRIARNARTDHFRRRRTAEQLPEQVELATPEPGPAEQLEGDRDARRLRRALMQLPEDKRDLLVLARYQQMKYERIAELLGVEVNVVKVRVHRAIKELRQLFGQTGDGEAEWTAKRSGTDLRII